MMSIKKKLTCMAAALALAFSAAAFVGCSEESADEAMIREALTAELDSIKNLDDDFMTELTAGTDAEASTIYGIAFEDFMAAYLLGFDYDIEDVSVSEDGASAVATVELTCKSLADMQTTLTANIQKVLESEEAASMGEEELNDLLAQAVVEALGSVEPTAIEPIVLEYAKANNVWTPTSESEQAIVSALLAG